MDFVERHTQSLGVVPEIWAATVSRLWNALCEWEGIPEDSRFVVFRPENPFLPFYNKAFRLWRESMYESSVLGYVGLEIDAGKASLPAFKKGRRQKPKG